MILIITLNILTMLKYSVWIDFFQGSVVRSWKMAIMFLLVFCCAFFGVTVGTMAIYGNTDLRYTSLSMAAVHMFYSSVVLEPLETVPSFADYLLIIANLMIYYILISYMLYAVFVSIMHETYRNIMIEKGDPHVQP